MSPDNFALLVERFDFLTERQSSDHLAVNCPADKLIELCTGLRDEFEVLRSVVENVVDAMPPGRIRSSGSESISGWPCTGMAVWDTGRG